MSGKPLVAIAMPRGSSAVRCSDAAEAFYFPTKRGIDRIPLRKSTSLAIRCFNLLLCDVLNLRKRFPITHFAMMHDDICPDDGESRWLDILLDELEATGADMVSAVVPIKNAAGCTSTAVDMDGAPWVTRRLTMTEIMGLPPTFTIDDIPWRLPESQLLVNSGLWLCRVDSGWMEKAFPLTNPSGAPREASLAFRDYARIVQLPNGEYVAEDISEDWDWSRQLNAFGLKLAATRKVGLYHERPEFHNREAWGAWATDIGYLKCMELLTASAAAA